KSVFKLVFGRVFIVEIIAKLNNVLTPAKAAGIALQGVVSYYQVFGRVFVRNYHGINVSAVKLKILGDFVKQIFERKFFVHVIVNYQFVIYPEGIIRIRLIETEIFAIEQTDV